MVKILTDNSDPPPPPIRSGFFCFPIFFFLKYRKFPIISPELIFVQKAFWWAYFRGRLFSEGLNIGGNFAFQNGLDLTIKNSPN